MANICNYEIHCRGSKKAALMLFASTQASEWKGIVHEEETDAGYVLWFKGGCKWDLDSGCTETDSADINLDLYSNADLREEKHGFEFWKIPMHQKAEIIGLEVIVRQWSHEDAFHIVDKYNREKHIEHKSLPLVPPCWDDVEDEFDSYQDYCEKYNIDPHANPPTWNKRQYKSYKAYCDAFGIDPNILPEKAWYKVGFGLMGCDIDREVSYKDEFDF